MSAYRVLVVSNVDAPYVRDDCAILGALGPVEFLRYRGRRDLGRLAIASLRSDIIVSWFAIGYATTAVLLGRVLRTPTVVIAAGWDVMALPELNYGALLSKGRARKTRYALEKASVVLAVSASTQEAAQKLVSREILVVPNAVDTNFLRPADLERHNQVITVAGVDNEVRYRVKGIDILVRVAERMQNVRFVLVGRNSPEWDERLRALAPPNLEIMGFVDRNRIRELYQESRVCFQPSAQESFCVSLVEAMACGCVPVASDRGALPEIVGKAGYVAPYGDVSASAGAISQALADNGQAARTRASSMFALDSRRDVLLSHVRRLL
ncbi:MAG TPA: glycosyltransferase family 4 protein [Thermoplasmata archaeon]|nr:glycosyltransferase family 4 protein [Thermoplasmata archaeon]